MSHHYQTRQTVLKAPKTLGAQLGRIAISKGLSVQDIAAKLGASRATVYNWFYGGTVSNAYKKPVVDLIAALKAQ